MLNQTSSKRAVTDKLKPILKHYNSVNSEVIDSMHEAWKLIAPVWPLQTYIARNPLSGLEGVPFVEAINTASKYLESVEIHEQLADINKETIKWCQAFFGRNQATISMPVNSKSFFISWKNLAIYDPRLHFYNKAKIAWLQSLPDDPLLSIIICLEKINIPKGKYIDFFRIMLATLPGWSGYVKYISEYADQNYMGCKVSENDYVAIRLIITSLLWPEVADILKLQLNVDNTHVSQLISMIKNNEINYRSKLIRDIESKLQYMPKTKECDAQFMFCIDVRSESYRRSIEAQGNYETFGYAGFFGVPVSIKKYDDAQVSALCPVLIKPKHVIGEAAACCGSQLSKYRYVTQIANAVKKLYKSMKYSFTTPFLLVEVAGPIFGLLMIFKTLGFKASKIGLEHIEMQPSEQDIQSIDFDTRCQYAKNALTMTGLVDNFAPIIFLCGHNSTTENNPYASALDCGACGGNKGGFNAQILAKILNDSAIRMYLRDQNIVIPKNTVFIAAQHNTTTDELYVFAHDQADPKIALGVEKIKKDLLKAQAMNMQLRAKALNLQDKPNLISKRSIDWSQTRPEWGLAKNASFIIGPRGLTKNIDLNGRAFLHSYNWENDPSGSSLESILTAPMVVAYWINSQYLFSVANNKIYGSGSKVTQNITGKFAIMQGNASDLMHGLPVQSVFDDQGKPYHEALRMLAVVYAPKILISKIIAKHKLLQNLFANSWISIVAIDPLLSTVHILNNDLAWELYKYDR